MVIWNLCFNEFHSVILILNCGAFPNKRGITEWASSLHLPSFLGGAVHLWDNPALPWSRPPAFNTPERPHFCLHRPQRGAEAGSPQLPGRMALPHQ